MAISSTSVDLPEPFSPTKKVTEVRKSIDSVGRRAGMEDR
jgi:hypothetical protein